MLKIIWFKSLTYKYFLVFLVFYDRKLIIFRCSGKLLNFFLHFIYQVANHLIENLIDRLIINKNKRLSPKEDSIEAPLF